MLRSRSSFVVEADADWKLAHHLEPELNAASNTIWVSNDGQDFTRPTGGQPLESTYATIMQKADRLAEIQQQRIRKLQDALIDERLERNRAYGSREDATFSLYRDGLASMGEVMRRTGLDRWEFSEYLDLHPEYQQVDLDGFLQRIQQA